MCRVGKRQRRERRAAGGVPAAGGKTKETRPWPRGDKSAYTDKQKRKAEHIEEGYEARGVPEKEAESRAWATVNKESGGGNKSGSGRGKAGHQGLGPEGRPHRRRGLRLAIRRRTLGLGEEGGGDPQAERSQGLSEFIWRTTIRRPHITAP
jgi:plasmid stabilization system protein ParE